MNYFSESTSSKPLPTCHPETPKQQHISLKTTLLQLICPIHTHQNHMPPRDAQTATHQLENNPFANQFTHTSAPKTTCHPETPKQQHISLKTTLSQLICPLQKNPKPHATQRRPNSNTSASKQPFCNSCARYKSTQNHMPSRDTQTATHQYYGLVGHETVSTTSLEP